MELVEVTRLLWGRRIIVGIGLVLAVVVGLLAGRGSAHAAPSTGLGTVQLLFDTSDSQLAEAAPLGADTLPMRAALLADTLATDTGRAAVARAVGVPMQQLAILGPSTRALPPVETPLVTQSAVAAVAKQPYVVDVFADEVTPIISIEAHAPDAERARSLAGAAAAGLRSLSVADDPSQSHGFVLDTVTPLRAKALAGPGRHRSMMMVAGAIATFALWCCGVVLLAAVSRRRRVRPRPRAARVA
jgi:hypothetical protein